MSPYAINRIKRERKAGKSLAAIANGLNADRIPTAQRGRRWNPTAVRYTLNKQADASASLRNAGNASTSLRFGEFW